MTPPNPVEALPLARLMRESLWAYGFVETVHIVGFAILVGSVVTFDLRVLGFSRDISVRALSRHVLPWSLGALLLIVPTGLLLFTAHAAELLGSRAFQLKMLLLLAAGINAVIFRTGPYAGVKDWDTGVQAPASARVLVALSIVIWISIIACGRQLIPT